MYTNSETFPPSQLPAGSAVSPAPSCEAPARQDLEDLIYYIYFSLTPVHGWYQEPLYHRGAHGERCPGSEPRCREAPERVAGERFLRKNQYFSLSEAEG